MSEGTFVDIEASDCVIGLFPLLRGERVCASLVFIIFGLNALVPPIIDDIERPFEGG